MCRSPRSGHSGETVILTVNADRGQRAAVERDVAAALARTEPAIAFVFRTFDQFIDARITQERLIAMLSTFFGGLALLLAGIGLYGIVAQAVRARQSEIGLRLALGAEPVGIMRLVFRRVGILIVVGLAVGLAGSLWAAQFVGPLLFQGGRSRSSDVSWRGCRARCCGCAGRLAAGAARRPS
jgi:ABC-type antimicrobial peptide transport system permease subunit